MAKKRLFPKLKGTKLEGFEPVEQVNELRSIDTKEGDGAVVSENATVKVHYTGALANSGQIFESSLDNMRPVSFGLHQVIEGWTLGLPGMKVGGRRRLIIPADLAYGSASPSPDIPKNSDLVFDIELVDII